ncbi:MAG TPA: tol-pal system protein YbgF [Bryobacteraceae bacterium]|nr:tol-pal system protein YbgF [Bryobacteraceae bacterium]
MNTIRILPFQRRSRTAEPGAAALVSGFALRAASCALLFLIGPMACFGENKQMVELQRDVASLQDSVRNLQRSLDEKVGMLTALLQQTLDSANKANASVAVLQNTINEKLSEQAKNVGGSAAVVGSKVDQMANEFGAVRESVADMNSRMARLEAKIVDLGNAVRTLNAPPPPPPGQGPTGPGTSTSAVSPGSSTAPPANMSAETTYNNAYADLQKGNFDLASQEFSDYLKYFPNTDYAPNAQFYLGDIYYRKGDFAAAAQAFDQVLERYPENSKTPSALYLKGMSLLNDHQRTAAAKEFRALIAKYPDDDLATKAKAELRKLGLSTSASPRRRQ